MWWFKKHNDAKTDNKSAEEKVEYTNYYTADGKRLKKISGGYTLEGTGAYEESGLRVGHRRHRSHTT